MSADPEARGREYTYSNLLRLDCIVSLDEQHRQLCLTRPDSRHEPIGKVTIRDPLLRSRHFIELATRSLSRPRRHTIHVGSSGGFGNGERDESLAREYSGEDFCLHLVVAKVENGR